jgi:hypothetical protein
MKISRTVCDVCHVEVTSGGSVLVVRAGTLTKYLTEPIDVCPDCENRVMALLRPDRDGQPLPQPQQQPRVGRCV